MGVACLWTFWLKTQVGLIIVITFKLICVREKNTKYNASSRETISFKIKISYAYFLEHYLYMIFFIKTLHNIKKTRKPSTVSWVICLL